MRLLVAAIISSLLLTPPALAKLTEREVKEWRADLRYLAEQIPKKHKNPFHTMTRAQLQKAVKELDGRIPTLNRNEIIVEMARIVAMIGDGHTRLNLASYDSMGYDRLGRDYLGLDEKIGFHQFPLKIYLFKDGLFIQAAAAEHASLAGARLLRIDNTGADKIYDAVKAIAFHDNEMTIRLRTPVLMVVPEVLQALGFIADVRKATFVVEKDGRTISEAVTARGQTDKVDWVDARDGSTAAVPLWLRRPNDNYWFEYLPESRTFYLQYNAVRPKADERPAAFFERVFQFADANPIDRFIIDLRLNQGGSTELNWPLIYGLIRSDKINQRGKLFAIIGRHTFSAASNCAIYLEKHTRAIFVGEPVGSRPNQYGDELRVVLPNSGITAWLSFIYWQEANPRDTRVWIGPQVAAELTSEQYRNNIDPAMEAILRFDPAQKTLSTLLDEAYKAKGIAGALDQYRAFKAEPVNAYAVSDSEVLRFADQLLDASQFRDAIAILQVLIKDYPLSRMAPVFLGVAAMNIGDRELAVRSFRKAVELNPANDYAIQRLKEAEQMPPPRN